MAQRIKSLSYNLFVMTLKSLRLSRELLKASTAIHDYNFRSYAERKIREAFRNNRNEADPGAIQELLREGESQLQFIQRHVMIGTLYGSRLDHVLDVVEDEETEETEE